MPTLAEILAEFPGATLGENCWETSPKSEAYNCFAWAAEDDTRHWDPRTQFHPYGGYWPRRAPAGLTVSAIEATFRMVGGYVRTNNDKPEPGICKVAVFAHNGRPTHMARQLASGKWASKLGADEDIEHSSPSVLEGGDYGRVVLLLARRVI